MCSTYLAIVSDHLFDIFLIYNSNFLQIKLKIGVTWFWLRFSTHSLGGRSWTKYENFHKMHMRWLFPGHHWHFGRSCNSQSKNWAAKKSWTCPRFQQINAKRCCRRRKTDTQGKKKKTIKRNIFLGNSRNLYMRKLPVISRYWQKIFSYDAI